MKPAQSLHCIFFVELLFLDELALDFRPVDFVSRETLDLLLLFDDLDQAVELDGWLSLLFELSVSFEVALDQDDDSSSLMSDDLRFVAKERCERDDMVCWLLWCASVCVCVFLFRVRTRL